MAHFARAPWQLQHVAPASALDGGNAPLEQLQPQNL